VGISALYSWYDRNADLAACVLRDAEHHAPTKEIAQLRFGPPMAEHRRVLGAGLPPRARALLAVGLNFHTWRTLAREAQLTPAAAADVVADAIAAACFSNPAGTKVSAPPKKQRGRRDASGRVTPRSRATRRSVDRPVRKT
jgi:hypothetical protein